jgi:hypothetical protein
MTTVENATTQTTSVPVPVSTRTPQPRAGVVRVYIAARGEDQALAAEVRAHLSLAGIGCTARWIDQSLTNESHDEAQQDIEDVRAAHVLVLLKPIDSHRRTTGGHHVETGIALERGLPVVLLGEIENVFHHHDQVTALAFPRSTRDFVTVATTILALASQGPRR